MLEGFLVQCLEWQQQADLSGGMYSRPQLENCKWRGKKERQENCQPPGLKKLANCITVNRLEHNWKKRNLSMRDNTYGSNVRVRDAVWRGCFNNFVATKTSVE